MSSRDFGFSGSRRRMSPRQLRTVRELLRGLGVRVLRHGDCLGADRQVHDEARDIDAYIIGHPPENDAMRAFCQFDEMHAPAPYLRRNMEIAKAPAGLIAAPSTLEETLRSGTWATVRYARALGRPVWIALPDGTVRTENGAEWPQAEERGMRAEGA